MVAVSQHGLGTMLGNHYLRPRPLILLAAALGLPAAPAQAADWRLKSARQTQFGPSLAFLDLQSIRGGDGRVQFSMITFFGRRTRGMNRAWAAVTADCGSMTYRFDQIVLSFNQRPLSYWRSAAPVPATPKTNVHEAIGAACGLGDTGRHVERVEAFAADYFRRRPRYRARSA